MGVSDVLAQELNRVYQGNPYLNFAQSMPQLPDRGTNESGIARGVQGIVQGIIASYGANQAQEQERNVYSNLARVLQQPNRVEAALNTPGMERFATTFQMEDLSRKQGLQDTLQKAFIDASFDPKRQIALQRSLPMLKQAGLLGDFQMPEAIPVSQETMGVSTVQPIAPMEQNLAGTINQRAQSLVQQAMGSGQDLSFSDAYKIASDDPALQLQKTQDAKELERISALRDTSSKRQLVANQIAGVLPQYEQIMSPLAVTVGSSLGIPSSQRAADTMARLENVKADLRSMARTPGEGTTSESESRMLTVPASTDVPKETLATIQQTLQERAARERDQADFLETRFKTKGTLQNARAEWQAYENKYPLVTVDPQTGVASVNTTRGDWRQELLGATVPQQQTPSSAPITPPSQAASQEAKPHLIGLPEPRPELMQALYQVESTKNPNAISPKGAIGIGQVMPATGAQELQELGMMPQGVDPIEYTKKALLNPTINKMISERYLAKQLKTFNGDENLALAAYNAGAGAVKSGKAATYKETQAYVPKVMSLVGQAQAAQPQEEIPQQAPQQEQAQPQQQEPGMLQQAAGYINSSPFLSNISDVGVGIAQGATFNTADELAALAESKATGQNYDELLARNRQKFKEARERSPGLTMAGDVVGSVASLPGKLAGGAIQGAKGLKALYEAAKVGGLTGAAYGFGEGEGSGVGGRVDKAVTGGLTGAAVSPLLVGGTQLAGKAIEKFTPTAMKAAEKIAGEIKRLNIDERGSIAGARAAAKPDVSADALLMKSLGAKSADDIIQIQQALSESQKKGGKLLMSDVADDSLGLTVSDLATNPKTATAMNTMREALSGRTAQAPERIDALFQGLGSTGTKRATGQKLAEVGQEILDDIKKPRMERADKLFNEAYEQMEKVDIPENIQKFPLFRTYANAAKKSVDFIDEATIPSNSDPRVVQKMLSDLTSDIQLAKRGAATIASQRGKAVTDRELISFKKKLEETIKGTPLQKARQAYAQDSKPINSLEETLFDTIQSLKKGDKKNAIRKIVNSDADEISELRTMYEQKDPQAWYSMVRTWVKDVVDEAKNSKGEDSIPGVILSKLGVREGAKADQKLNALLGDEMYQMVQPYLDLERKYVSKNAMYALNSLTAPRQAARESLESNNSSKLAKFFTSPKQTIGNYASEALTAPNEEAITRMAQILADPKESLQFIDRAIPVQKRLDAAQKLADQFTSVNKKASVGYADTANKKRK